MTPRAIQNAEWSYLLFRFYINLCWCLNRHNSVFRSQPQAVFELWRRIALVQDKDQNGNIYTSENPK